MSSLRNFVEGVLQPLGVADALEGPLLDAFYGTAAPAPPAPPSPPAAAAAAAAAAALHPCDAAPSDCAAPMSPEQIEALQQQLWWCLHDTIAFCLINFVHSAPQQQVEEEERGGRGGRGGETSRSDASSSRTPQRFTHTRHGGGGGKSAAAAAAGELAPFSATEWLFVMRCAADLGLPRCVELAAQLPHRANIDELVLPLLWLARRFALVWVALRIEIAECLPLGDAWGGASSMRWPPSAAAHNASVAHRQRQLRSITHAKAQGGSSGQLSCESKLCRLIDISANAIRHNLLLRADQAVQLGLRSVADLEVCAARGEEEEENQRGYDGVMRALERLAQAPERGAALTCAIDEAWEGLQRRIAATPALLAVYECDRGAASEALTLDAALPPLRAAELRRSVENFRHSGPDAQLVAKWHAVRRRLSADGSARSDALMREMRHKAQTIAQNLDTRYTFSSCVAAELAVPSAGAAAAEAPPSEGEEEDVSWQQQQQQQQQLLAPGDGPLSLLRCFSLNDDDGHTPRSSAHVAETQVGVPAPGRTTSAAVDIAHLEAMLTNLTAELAQRREAAQGRAMTMLSARSMRLVRDMGVKAITTRPLEDPEEPAAAAAAAPMPGQSERSQQSGGQQGRVGSKPYTSSFSDAERLYV